MFLRSLILVALIVLVTGCGQSFDDAMKIVCDPTPYMTEVPDNPVERQVAFAITIQEHVTNQEVKRLMKSLPGLSPADRQSEMQFAVDRAGLSSCFLLDE